MHGGTGFETLMLIHNPCFGHAFFVRVGEKGAGGDLFGTGQLLDMWGVGRQKLPEKQAVGSQGGKRWHVLMKP